MKKFPAQKQFYLPGTNKNVGYILGNTMHIYKKYIKYFPVNTNNDFKIGASGIGEKFIIKEKNEKHLELDSCVGWYLEVNEKMYTFYDCTFKTPDNLDVIEMAYLYKHWKTNGRSRKNK
jgi:hypothetical protein